MRHGGEVDGIPAALRTGSKLDFVHLEKESNALLHVKTGHFKTQKPILSGCSKVAIFIN